MNRKWFLVSLIVAAVLAIAVGGVWLIAPLA